MIESIIKRIPLLSKYSFESLEIQKLSGLTNNNYLIITPEKKYVLRIPRYSTNTVISRNNEAYNLKIVQQLSIAPNTLWQEKNKPNNFTGVSLTEYVENNIIVKQEDLHNPRILKKISETLIILRDSKKTFSSTTDNQKIAALLKQYFELCTLKQQKTLLPNYQKALTLLSSQICSRPNVPSHLDLVVENILLQKNKVWIIDWEYSAMASPLCDIAIICNSAMFDISTSEIFLKMVFDDYQDIDLQHLNYYRFIAQVVSDCWQMAFQKLPK